MGWSACMGLIQRVTNRNRTINKSQKFCRISRFIQLILLPSITLINPFDAKALDFYRYLSVENEKTLEFVRMIYYVIEDTPQCKRDESLLGYVLPMQDLYVICTKRIVRSSITNIDASNLINETVTHENVHALQLCTPNDILGYSIPEHIVEKVSKIDGYRDLDKDSLQMEYEAFYLELFPEVVMKEAENIDDNFCYNQHFKYQ